MEAKYAPPDHEVFQLTPPPFDRQASEYYNKMERPEVNSKTFWDVYRQLLVHFKMQTNMDLDLATILQDNEDRATHISNEKVELLPDAPFRLGNEGVAGPSDPVKKSLYVAITSDEDSDSE